jgi:hypothetical protein
MRLMYDGIYPDAATIAALHPQMVAGYLDGSWAWSAEDWGYFPSSTVKVQIVVTASANEGDVLDVENGDATPAQTEGWIRMRKAAGYYRPTIYCNLSTVPAVRSGTGPYVLGTDYDLWVADYDDSTASVYSNSVATQYETTDDWDVSAVYDDEWPHRTAPAPAPAATYGPPKLTEVSPGHTTVLLKWSAPGALNGVAASEYQVFVYKGTSADEASLVSSYPRTFTGVLSAQVGSLSERTEYTVHLVAGGKNMSGVKADVFASAMFTTGG